MQSSPNDSQSFIFTPDYPHCYLGKMSLKINHLLEDRGAIKMHMKRKIFTVSLVLFLSLFSNHILAKESEHPSPFFSLPGDLRLWFSKTYLRGDDFLRLSETCTANRQICVDVLLREIRADRTNFPKLKGSFRVSECNSFADLIEAFQAGDPHVVFTILGRFPDMSPQCVYRTLGAMFNKRNIIPEVRAYARYRLARLRLDHRVTDEQSKPLNAYELLEKVCDVDSVLSDEIKGHATYLMAKSRAEYDFRVRFRVWEPKLTYAQAFTILTQCLPFLGPLELLETNFLRGCLRLENRVNDFCLSQAEANKMMARSWKTFKYILKDDSVVAKEKARVLRFMFNFLHRTKEHFDLVSSDIPTMQNAWSETLESMTNLLDSKVYLPVQVRSDLREKKLTLLMDYTCPYFEYYLPAKGLLEEFLNRESRPEIRLNLEHAAEITMVERMKELASCILLQNTDALVVIRSFLMDYVPTDHASRDIKTDAKACLVETLWGHLSTPKLCRGEACASRRILVFDEKSVTRENLETFLQEPEILPYMKVKQGPLKKRARSQFTSSYQGPLRVLSREVFKENLRGSQEYFEGLTEYVEGQDPMRAFSCPSFERVATMSLGTFPMDTDEDE